MPLKTKSIITKAGDRHRITISTIDSSVKAAPLDPVVAATIKGEAIAEEVAKVNGKEENKRLDKQEANRKKKNRKVEQQQKRKAVKESKKLADDGKKKKV